VFEAVSSAEDGDRGDRKERSSCVECLHAAGDGRGVTSNNATSTISPLDRLEALTLPALADVHDGLDTYREQVDRAAELDAQIERTDELIDEIVYDLYGLTDEEIEIVEDAVGD
jgi:hypothetical protein